MMTTIYLIRHGESRKNAANVVQREGHEDDNNLTEFGIFQARSVAYELANIQLDALYTSPLLRAQSTASYIAETSGLTPIIHPKLHEKNKGAIDHMTISQHLHAYGDWGAMSEESRWQAKLVPDEESMWQVYERAISVLREIATSHPNQTIAVVTHGGVMRSLYTKLTDKSLKDMWKFQNCGYMVLHVDGEQIEVTQTVRLDLIDRSLI